MICLQTENYSVIAIVKVTCHLCRPDSTVPAALGVATDESGGSLANFVTQTTGEVRGRGWGRVATHHNTLGLKSGLDYFGKLFKYLLSSL